MNQTNIQIVVLNARLSFPALWKPTSMDPDQEPKFQATFILDAGSPGHKEVARAVKEVIASAWGGKAPGGLKLCLRDGAEKSSLDGYGEDKVFFSARSARRPTVLTRDKRPAEENELGAPYAGCYVNGIVTLWAQDNKWGKRVNAALDGVQFVADGERFGSGGASPDMFPDVAPGDDDEEEDRDGDPFGGLL